MKVSLMSGLESRHVGDPIVHHVLFSVKKLNLSQLAVDPKRNKTSNLKLSNFKTYSNTIKMINTVIVAAMMLLI